MKNKNHEKHYKDKPRGYLHNKGEIYFLFIQIKLAFFHGLRIYMSRIAESYELAYIYIYNNCIVVAIS
jgi:hypothetical protein